MTTCSQCSQIADYNYFFLRRFHFHGLAPDVLLWPVVLCITQSVKLSERWIIKAGLFHNITVFLLSSWRKGPILLPIHLVASGQHLLPANNNHLSEGWWWSTVGLPWDFSFFFQEMSSKVILFSWHLVWCLRVEGVFSGPLSPRRRRNLTQ